MSDDLVKRLREHAENMYVDFLNEAADAIEVLERDAVLVTDAMVALTDRVQELKAALKPFADASDLHLGSDDMSIAFRIIIGNLRQARKVLENA